MRTIVTTMIVLTVGLVAAVTLINMEPLLQFLDERIRLLSPFESALLILAWVSLGTVLMIPASILFVVSGSIFGIWWSLLFNTIGFLIGSNAAFALGRYAFHSLVENKAGDTLRQFNRGFSAEGWQSIAVVRLTPVFPSFILNYLLGVTHVRWWDYLWATFVFTLPGGFLLTYLGDTGRAALEGGNNLVVRGVVIASLILALAILARIIRNRARNPQTTRGIL